ncbi:MAG: formylmethanofuran dehydrogenase subunit E family protein, partial [Bacteroidales bacterium]|nr:formylmethanofuran dehydrogenase subunit E family protein [Bacteroidales bacterium]
MVDERERQLVELVNRFHGHIGIYSMLGVKMGLYVKDIFSADGLTGHIGIVAYTGSVPPVSCLLDGLQASTGSTLGHGLIKVAPTPAPPRAKATFTC